MSRIDGPEVQAAARRANWPPTCAVRDTAVAVFGTPAGLSYARVMGIFLTWESNLPYSCRCLFVRNFLLFRLISPGLDAVLPQELRESIGLAGVVTSAAK